MLHMVLLQIESGTFAPNIIKAFFSSRSQPQTLTTDSLVRYQSDLRNPYLHLRSGEPTNGEVRYLKRMREGKFRSCWWYKKCGGLCIQRELLDEEKGVAVSMLCADT